MRIPNDDFKPDDIKPRADLRRADLSEADLRRADLVDADLRWADLSEANLRRVDLSGSDLSGANLSEANLNWADLSGANLVGADLSGIKLLEINLSDASVSRETQIEAGLVDIKEMASQIYQWENPESPRIWDAVARVNHELKIVYSANGLVGRARKYHVRERRARRREAKAESGLTGYSAWFGSLLSRVVTGYGVQLRWVGGFMLLIYFASAAIYHGSDMGIRESLYYSIVTFTTAPPSPPPDDLITKTTAMIETFGGTLLIVLLGYVLGNREQV